MSIAILEPASWSGEEDVGSNSPCSDQMQNSPTSSQSSARSDGDLENTCNPNARQGRRKLKRRRKRMLTGVSRQRRAANERERRRIQGVNRAFVELKNALPLANTVDISKIDILRVAAKWIDHLTKLLDQDQKMCNAKEEERHASDEPQLYEILGEEFSIIDDELEDDDFLQGQDIWSDTPSDLCVPHTVEPCLQTLLHNSFQSDISTSPLLELTNEI